MFFAQHWVDSFKRAQTDANLKLRDVC